MSTNASRRGFFRTAMDAMIAARQKQAAMYVNHALLGLDDATLKAHGYDRAELARKSQAAYF